MADFDAGVKGCPKCSGALELVDQSEPRTYIHMAVLQCVMPGCGERWVYKRELAPLSLQALG